MVSMDAMEYTLGVPKQGTWQGDMPESLDIKFRLNRPKDG